MNEAPPCENCITLAMCKSKVANGDLFDLIHLSDKCVHLKYFIFPSKNPLITAEQKSIPDVNKHIDICLLILRESLLYNINFNDQFSFRETNE